ncbi:MAG TPA: DUF4230 domain-containing protein [Gemmatimonadales bacterium]|nr:DUF4230 domain-containing protein [Gemmatimonadales bacterium]
MAIGWRTLALAGVVLIAAIYGVRTATGGWQSLFGRRTTVTHEVALGRLESVGKLVTTEAGLRDIVVYQDTRLGSTKKSLVVVTGKALVGIDLKHGASIDIDETARRIRITVPHARLIGVDIASLKTYDESRGLWNWFKPEDRDEIFGLAHDQLRAAARDMAVVEHAEQGARALLGALFAGDGYTVDVVFTPAVTPPAD